MRVCYVEWVMTDVPTTLKEKSFALLEILSKYSFNPKSEFVTYLFIICRVQIRVKYILMIAD